MNGEDLAQGVDTVVKAVCFFERVDGGFGLAEALLSLGEGDVARGDVAFEIDGLLEGHSSLFVGARLEID